MIPSLFGRTPPAFAAHRSRRIAFAERSFYFQILVPQFKPLTCKGLDSDAPAAFSLGAADSRAHSADSDCLLRSPLNPLSNLAVLPPFSLRSAVSPGVIGGAI